MLNGKTLSCESLQVINVDKNYTLSLNNNTYTHLQKTLSHKKTYTLERGVYHDLHNTIDSFKGNLYDSFIQIMFLDKIGKVSHEKSATFGIVLFIFVLLTIGIVYWKCACCRKHVDTCCLSCMPDYLHAWRENRALAELRREQERAERLRELDPEARPGTSTNQHHDGTRSALGNAPGGAPALPSAPTTH